MYLGLQNIIINGSLGLYSAILNTKRTGHQYIVSAGRFCRLILKRLCKPGNMVLKMTDKSRSHRPRGLKRGSVAARLLRLWVRIPPGAWMFLCCECCV